MATFPGADLQAQSNTPAKPGLFVIGQSGQAVLYWSELDDSSIIGWEYQHKVGTGNWSGWTPISGADANTYTHTVTGLSGGLAQRSKVRAVNANGSGAVSDEASDFLSTKVTTLTAAPNPVTEGNTGTTTVILTLTLPEAAPTGQGVTTIFTVTPVYSISTTASDSTYMSVCGSHATQHDICRSTGNASFAEVPQGEKSLTFSYEIVGDTRDEDDEVVYLRQGGHSGWSSSVVRVVIVRDDDAPTHTGTPANTSAPLVWLTDTPVPTRSRLAYRRSNAHHTPRASTATPVVQCLAHRRGP